MGFVMYLFYWFAVADPYLNTDAGTMSPFEHGEVFVLDDGGEVTIITHLKNMNNFGDFFSASTD